MKIKLLVIMLILFFINSEITSQNSDYGSVTKTYDLSSEADKKYKVKVTVPRNFDVHKSYKTLYYLDAWWNSEIVSGTYAILNLSESIEDIVLVGLSLVGDEKDWHIQRSFDFTPSTYDIDIMGFEMRAGKGKDTVSMNENTTGGANDYIAFLENDLINFLNKEYSNLNLERGLIGHSYGGLFCFYVLQKAPHLFSDYIIISPSLWWNKSELLSPEKFSNFVEDEQKVNIHLSYGAQESSLISKPTKAANDLLSNLGKEGLKCQFEMYEKASHNSILSRAIYDGLLYIYGVN